MAADDAYTSLLSHFDGADASTTFTDEVGHTINAVGNAQLDTAFYKFGTASLLLDGNDYCTVAADASFAWNTGAFTWECWVRGGTLGTSHHGIIESRVDEGTTGILLETLNKVASVWMQGQKIAGTTSFVDGTWYHLAVVGNGGGSGSRTIKLYVNGTQEGSTWTYDYNFTNTSLIIGETYGFGLGWNGHIDEMRLSLGVQRYTGNFTQPTNPFGIPSAKYYLKNARRNRFERLGVSVENPQ